MKENEANDILKKAFSRRAFLAGAGLASAFGAASLLNLAMADGGGEGDVEDDNPGGGTASYWGFEWVWFDEGGFESTEDGLVYEPTQKWESDSEAYFWGLIQDRANEVGKQLYGNDQPDYYFDRMGNSGGEWAGYEDMYKRIFYSAMDEALANARARAGEDKARIVAVGWTAYYNHELNASQTKVYKAFDHGCKLNTWSEIRTPANVLPFDSNNFYDYYLHQTDENFARRPNFRVGNTINDLGANAQNDGGWEDRAILPNGQEYSTWREYLKHIFHEGTTAANDKYVVIALAVADSEPPLQGKVKVEKASSNPDATSGNPSFSLSGAKFKIYIDEACTKEAKDVNGDPIELVTDSNGITGTVDLRAREYWVKETTAPKGFKLNENGVLFDIAPGDDLTVKVTNEPNVGRLSLAKLSANQSYTSGNANYGLEDVWFHVYADDGSGKPGESAGWLITGKEETRWGKKVNVAHDYSNHDNEYLELVVGKYYVREEWRARDGAGKPKGYIAGAKDLGNGYFGGDLYEVEVKAAETAWVDATKVISN